MALSHDNDKILFSLVILFVIEYEIHVYCKQVFQPFVKYTIIGPHERDHNKSTIIIYFKVPK